jgi:hypothetical protein
MGFAKARIGRSVPSVKFWKNLHILFATLVNGRLLSITGAEILPQRDEKKLRPYLANTSRADTAFKLRIEIFESKNKHWAKNWFTPPGLNQLAYSVDAAEMRRIAIGIHQEASSTLDLE